MSSDHGPRLPCSHCKGSGNEPEAGFSDSPCADCHGTGGAKDGAKLITAERERQTAAEGWTSFHDDTHRNGEMARAAACYALQHTRVSGRALRWPWSREWWKPKDPIRNLVRAGALIAAEIDRLQRQKGQS